LAGLSPESALAMAETIGTEAVISGMGGEQLGGMLGAMDAAQMGAAFTDQALTEVAGKMTGDDAKNMDGESAVALLDAVITVMEPGEVGNKGSAADAGLVAALLGTMDSDQVQNAITPEMAADLAGKMAVSDVMLLDSDSAAAMVISMGAETAVTTMDQDSLTTMIGVMDAETIAQSLDGAAAGELVGALTGDNLESLGSDQVVGMANAMDAGQISELTADQANGMATAIAGDPSQVIDMEPESVAAMVSTMEASDLGVLGSDMVGSMVASMGADEIEGMSDDHLAEALETVGADYIGSGSSGFAEIATVETFVAYNLEAPDSLTEVMDSEGAASLFGSMFN